MSQRPDLSKPLTEVPDALAINTRLGELRREEKMLRKLLRVSLDVRQERQLREQIEQTKK